MGNHERQCLHKHGLTDHVDIESFKLLSKGSRKYCHLYSVVSLPAVISQHIACKHDVTDPQWTEDTSRY